MASSLGSLWLKSLKRMAKAPRAKGRQLVKSAVAKTMRSLVDTAFGSTKRASSRPKVREKPSAMSLAAPAVRPGNRARR